MSVSDRQVAVCGGINLDIHVRAQGAPLIRRTSNPAHVHLSAGGVGRNIAHDLASLGVPVVLLGAVGDDQFSAQVLEETAAAGADTSRVRRVEGVFAGMYVALLDGDGELDVAAADMRAIESIDARYVDECRTVLERSSLIVADANLPVDALQRILDVAAVAGVRVILEPVSDRKAERVRALRGPVFALTPNDTEAAVLGDRCGSLRAEHTLVTCGPRGVRWIDHAAGTEREFPARSVRVADVTGAGDAFVAGLVCGLLRAPGEAREAGQAMHAAMEAAIGVALEAARVVVGSTGSTLSRDDGRRICVAARMS